MEFIDFGNVRLSRFVNCKYNLVADRIFRYWVTRTNRVDILILNSINCEAVTWFGLRLMKILVNSQYVITWDDATFHSFIVFAWVVHLFRTESQKRIIAFREWRLSHTHNLNCSHSKSFILIFLFLYSLTLIKLSWKGVSTWSRFKFNIIFRISWNERSTYFHFNSMKWKQILV